MVVLTSQDGGNTLITGPYTFFSKINLVTATKKIFKIFFSDFESEDNIKIEYIWVNMLMFRKNPIKRC